MVDVSIVIPTCNRPVLLERALASVNQQCGTFSRECIVVNDGARHSAKRIRAITKQAGARYKTSGEEGGRGGAVARNRGVAAANGTYIAFLDDDDAWTEDKLLQQLSFMYRTSYCFSYTAKHIVSPAGQQRYSLKKPASDNHHRAIMRRNFIGTTSAVMVNKDVFLAAGGFDERLPALQDYDLFIRLLLRHRVGWLSAPLTYYYTEHAAENVSASRERYMAAVAYMSKKYQNDPYASLLRRYFTEIFFLKCFRSPRFLSETIRSILHRS